MLKDDYYESFPTGAFWLDCPRMQLTPQTSVGEVYTGAGYVRQMPEGRLEYVLLAPERVGDVRSALGTKYVPGSLASEYGKYSFEARDSKGRRWTSETEMVATESVDGEVGIACRGPLHVLVTESKNEVESVDRLWLHIPQAVPLPLNVLSTTTVALGKEVVAFSGRRDPRRFQRNGWQFTFRSFADSTELALTIPSGELAAHLDSRIEEARWFAFSRHVWWSMMTSTTGGVSRTHLRFVGKSGSRPRL